MSRFRKGDFVRNDYLAYFNGCPGHQSRLAILGQPDPEQQAGYDLTLDVHRKTIDKCRPGVTAGEIYEFSHSEFRKRASIIRHRSLGTGWAAGFTSKNLSFAGTARQCSKRE